MIYGAIPDVGRPVSRLVLGASHLKERREAEAFRLCDAFLASGGNAFDTAHVYGQGDSERTLGRWLHQRGLRDRVVIVDKGAHPDGERSRLNPADIAADLRESLERLRTDFVDLYLLHRDDPAREVGPLLECLNEQREQGRIRAYGVSNWSVRRIQEANDYAARHGLPPPAASSPHFSLAEQVAPPWPGCVTLTGPDRRDDREWYASQSIALLGWSALAGGWLLWPEAAEPETAPGPHEQIAARAYDSPSNRERRRRLAQLAGERDLSARIAVAYVLGQPTRPFAVIAAATEEECRDTAAGCETALSRAELEWLDLRRDTR